MLLCKLWILFQAWSLVVPFAVHAAPDPKPSSEPNSLPDSELTPQIASNALVERVIPAVPALLGWLGSIGGVLGIISFTDTYINKIIDLFTGLQPKKGKKKKAKPSWNVAIQIGLDGAGLKGAEGDFPQICLWNAQGQILGYNDQEMVVWHGKSLYKGRPTLARPDGMPKIQSGGLQGVGIWPLKVNKKLKANQAAYVTMIKRHFDAICIASVHVQWPDDSIWSFDGSWGRASNMSWYHSHTYGGDGRPQECFWLDHRGTLKHDQDRKEEYILADNDFPYKYRDPSKKATEYISWLKASSVDPEDGIPTGSELLEGMRANEVDQYRVPLGVKFHLPSYKRSTYPRNFDSLTLDDFVFNPGKLDWIYNSLVQRVRRGNPVLPILDPNEDIANPDIQLVWEDEFKQAIPRNCLTDWFWDEEGTFIGPSPDWNWKYTDPKQRKGPYRMKEEKWEALDYYGRKRDNRVTEVDGPSETTPSPPLRERHARTLVNDRNPSADHGVAKALCEDPYSVGPSYAHHAERQFCRMTDKTLMPFCDSAAGISTNCFDADAEVPVGETMPIGKRTVYWDAIEEWKDGERTKRPA